jgi:transposase
VKDDLEELKKVQEEYGQLQKQTSEVRRKRDSLIKALDAKGASQAKIAEALGLSWSTTHHLVMKVRKEVQQRL